MRVFVMGLPQGTPFTTLHQRLFHILSFFGHPGLVKRDIFHCRQTQPVSREYHTQCYVVEIQTLVWLNPDILVRRLQRIIYGIQMVKWCNQCDIGYDYLSYLIPCSSVHKSRFQVGSEVNYMKDKIL